MLEIEFKYRLPEGDIGAFIVDKLDTLPVVRRVLEQDTHGTVDSKYIRYRESLNIDTGEVSRYLIYKSPALRPTIGEKVRKEIEIPINEKNSIVTVNFVKNLCSEMLPTITKQRTYYQVQDYVITLDRIKGLGTFVEIEILSENTSAILALKQLAEALGLKSEWLVYDDNYGVLLQRKLSIVSNDQ
jgi:adenylate cyclase class 2